MKYLTPLKIELSKLNINENYDLIIHEDVKHLCLGVKYNNAEVFFDKPIDISKSDHNIFYDGENKFDVYHVEEKNTKKLIKLINTTVEIFFNKSSDKIILKSDNECMVLEFCIIDCVKDFMSLTINQCNQLSSNYELIHNGKLLEITLLYKVFETSIPMVNTKTSIEYRETTTKVTAEIGLQLSFSKKEIILSSPNLQFLDKGIIEIADNTNDIIEFAAANKLKKSRSL